MSAAGKGKQGFASMPADKQRAIARAGGRAAHASGKAYRWTTEEARAAGAKGGGKNAQDREHMAEIGRKGGKARAAQAAERRAAERAAAAATTKDEDDDARGAA